MNDEDYFAHVRDSSYENARLEMEYLITELADPRGIPGIASKELKKFLLEKLDSETLEVSALKIRRAARHCLELLDADERRGEEAPIADAAESAE
jgi:hypothetical protein